MSENKKEERSEYVGLYVTPSFKIELEASSSNEVIKEQLIKNFFTREKAWLEEEMTEIDEATLKYKAKLLTIKDRFSEAQEAYVEKIEDIYNVASKTFSKLDGLAGNIEKKLALTHQNIRTMSDSIGRIDAYPLERMLTAIDRYNSMSEEDKGFMKLLLKEKE